VSKAKQTEEREEGGEALVFPLEDHTKEMRGFAKK
jgi:hypothetical protein